MASDLPLVLETMAVPHLMALRKKSHELHQAAYALDKEIEELQDSLNGRYQGDGDNA